MENAITPVSILGINKFRARLQAGSLGNQISWIVVQSGTEAGLMTIASLFVAGWFGPELLGYLGVLLAGVQLVTMIAEGLSASVVRFVSRESAEETGREASAGWKLTWYSLLLIVIISIATGGIAWFIGGSELSLAWILLAVLLSITRSGRSAFEACFRGLRSFKDPAVSGIAFTVVMAGLLLGFAAAGYRISWYLGIMGVCMGLNTAYLAVRMRSSFRLAKAPRWSLKKHGEEFIKFSYPLMGRGLVTFFFLKINIWILGWASAADAGEFRLADQFLTIPFLLISAVLAAVAPRIVHAQKCSIQTFTSLNARTYGLMLLITVPIALIFLFAQPLISLFFPAFTQAGILIMIFAPVVIARGFGNVASIMLVQGGQPKAAFYISLGSSAANVIFAIAGYKLWGLIGLTAATAIVHFVSYGITVIVAHKLFQMPFQISRPI